MIWDNILRRMNAASLLLKQVKSVSGLSTVVKSSYYRSVIVIMATLVEGLVYELVKKHTTPPDHVFRKTYKYTEVCKIGSGVLGTSKDVHLYRREKNGMKITDSGANFKKLNYFLYEKKVVNKRQFEALEWIRDERNRLHIQGLSSSDTGYTEVKVIRMAKAIDFLIKKV